MATKLTLLEESLFALRDVENQILRASLDDGLDPDRAEEIVANLRREREFITRAVGRVGKALRGELND